VALYAGVMSGTSLDGIDVALVEFEGEAERPAASNVVGFHTEKYADDLRESLREAAEEPRVGVRELCGLNFELGRVMADVVETACGQAGVSTSDVVAVGSHGHTVWHQPPGDQPGATLQIGEAAVLAERLGVPVVADFRVRDVAAGGHGAPLTAYFDWLLLSSPDAARGIQNIGGMANITALPVADSAQSPIAFDTGPGVALIDAAARALTDGEREFDEDGRMAAAGQVVPAALAEWLRDPFFDTPPPRTTGRERFGSAPLLEWLERHAILAATDLMATITELTARSIADAVRWVPFQVDEVYLCGGGARNPVLRERLEKMLEPRPVRLLEALGWNGDAREAAAFALLARQHLLGIAASAPWATGASGPRVLGKLIPV
jgi:anhydro-N-acetylmuramic acid kinase